MKRKTLTEAFDIKPVKNKTSELTDYEIFPDKTLLDNCTEIKRILISSVNTAKENMK